MSRKRIKPRRKQVQKNTMHCMDCGVLLTPDLTENIIMTRRNLKMPNMLIFCNDCQFKFKNRLRRIWSGMKHLFE
jgi:hypothetical protein